MNNKISDLVMTANLLRGCNVIRYHSYFQPVAETRQFIYCPGAEIWCTADTHLTWRCMQRTHCSRRASITVDLLLCCSLLLTNNDVWLNNYRTKCDWLTVRAIGLTLCCWNFYLHPNINIYIYIYIYITSLTQRLPRAVCPLF